MGLWGYYSEPVVVNLGFEYSQAGVFQGWRYDVVDGHTIVVGFQQQLGYVLVVVTS